MTAPTTAWDEETGMPEYLKIRSISKSQLEGSGFPVENEIVLEETVL